MIPRIAPELPGAEMYYVERFLDVQAGARLFDLLFSNAEWSRRQFRGRPIPRSEIYMGDPGTTYTYSGRTYEPRPWIPTNGGAPPKCSTCDGYGIQFCVDDLYLDGTDSVGLHADAEPEYGRNPVIASVSLGGARLFRMKQIQGDRRWEIALPHGSLLVMASETQHNWRHEIPKDATCDQARINLTFRRVIPLEYRTR